MIEFFRSFWIKCGTVVVGRHRPKVMALSAALSLAFIGLVARYFHRRRRSRFAVEAGSESRAQRGASPSLRSSSVLESRIRGTSASSWSGASASTVLNTSDQRRFVNHTQDALILLGLDNFSEALSHWEKAASFDEFKGRSETELLEEFRRVIDRAHGVHLEMVKLTQRHCIADPHDGLSATAGGRAVVGFTLDGASVLTPVPETGSVISMNYRMGERRTMSILSDDSFLSALDDLIPFLPEIDVILREALDLPLESLQLYQAGLKEVKTGKVPCRVIRCLHANLFRELLTDIGKRLWFIDKGRVLIESLLQRAGKKSDDFVFAYEKMIDFINQDSSWTTIEEELRGRQVSMFTFYDIVLDFVFMDAFDDLGKPPASALAVAQNRFLSAHFKEQTLGTIVWSVLKAKRARLQNTSGFIAHFYDISEHVSPTLAWGFLGTNEKLRELCYFFKDQICSLLNDIFSIERVRYTSIDEFIDDLWQFCVRRCQIIEQKLTSTNDDDDS